MRYYTGDIYPEKNTIFVFGSNPEGRHGLGSAKVAVKRFGAVYGKGEGLYGESYALPTTDLRTYKRPSMSREEIINNILKLYACAESHPDKNFKIAYRSISEKTLCGYSGYELVDMFKTAGKLNQGIPTNIIISEEWNSIWYDI